MRLCSLLFLLNLVGADDVSAREEDILLVDPNSQACNHIDEGKGNYRDLGFRFYSGQQCWL